MMMTTATTRNRVMVTIVYSRIVVVVVVCRWVQLRNEKGGFGFNKEARGGQSQMQINSDHANWIMRTQFGRLN